MEYTINKSDLPLHAKFYANWRDLKSINIKATDNDSIYQLTGFFNEYPFKEDINYFTLKYHGMVDLHNNNVNSLIVYSDKCELKHNIINETSMITSKNKSKKKCMDYYIIKDLNNIFGKGLYKIINQSGKN
jgi:hypothetical protein